MDYIQNCFFGRFFWILKAQSIRSIDPFGTRVEMQYLWERAAWPNRMYSACFILLASLCRD